ncbi:unnamed protein product, partial [Choristocarpus tenellus]
MQHPHFGKEGERARYCGAHRLDGMFNVKHRCCAVKSCRGRVATADGERSKYCILHLKHASKEAASVVGSSGQETESSVTPGPTLLPSHYSTPSFLPNPLPPPPTRLDVEGNGSRGIGGGGIGGVVTGVDSAVGGAGATTPGAVGLGVLPPSVGLPPSIGHRQSFGMWPPVEMVHMVAKDFNTDFSTLGKRQRTAREIHTPIHGPGHEIGLEKPRWQQLPRPPYSPGVKGPGRALPLPYSPMPKMPLRRPLPLQPLPPPHMQRSGAMTEGSGNLHPSIPHATISSMQEDVKVSPGGTGPWVLRSQPMSMVGAVGVGSTGPGFGTVPSSAGLVGGGDSSSVRQLQFPQQQEQQQSHRSDLAPKLAFPIPGVGGDGSPMHRQHHHAQDALVAKARHSLEPGYLAGLMGAPWEDTFSSSSSSSRQQPLPVDNTRLPGLGSSSPSTVGGSFAGVGAIITSTSAGPSTDGSAAATTLFSSFSLSTISTQPTPPLPPPLPLLPGISGLRRKWPPPGGVGVHGVVRPIPRPASFKTATPLKMEGSLGSGTLLQARAGELVGPGIPQRVHQPSNPRGVVAPLEAHQPSHDPSILPGSGAGWVEGGNGSNAGLKVGWTEGLTMATAPVGGFGSSVSAVGAGTFHSTVKNDWSLMRSLGLSNPYDPGGSGLMPKGSAGHYAPSYGSGSGYSGGGSVGGSRSNAERRVGEEDFPWVLRSREEIGQRDG